MTGFIIDMADGFGELTGETGFPSRKYIEDELYPRFERQAKGTSQKGEQDNG